MTNYKSKYLEMKLKYINAKNKLTGGDLSGVEFLKLFKNVTDPERIKQSHNAAPTIANYIMEYYHTIVNHIVFNKINDTEKYNFILTKLGINDVKQLDSELVRKIIIEILQT